MWSDGVSMQGKKVSLVFLQGEVETWIYSPQRNLNTTLDSIQTKWGTWQLQYL